MTRRFLTALFALVALIGLYASVAMAQAFGVPNTSNAPPTGSPIEIEDCKAGQSGGLLLAESDGKFAVEFTNEGNVTADLIRFQIDFGSERLFIRDAGKFSPGVTIKHTFRRRGGNVVSSPLFSPAKLQCIVAAVHFIDGTEWTPKATESVTQVDDNGWLGLELKQQPDGVYVALVLPGGPADAAGFHQGDRIVSIETNKIATLGDALTLINDSPPGTKLHISVVRNNDFVEITATVRPRTSSSQP